MSPCSFSYLRSSKRSLLEIIDQQHEHKMNAVLEVWDCSLTDVFAIATIENRTRHPPVFLQLLSGLSV